MSRLFDCRDGLLERSLPHADRLGRASQLQVPRFAGRRDFRDDHPPARLGSARRTIHARGLQRARQLHDLGRKRRARQIANLGCVLARLAAFQLELAAPALDVRGQRNVGSERLDRDFRIFRVAIGLGR